MSVALSFIDCSLALIRLIAVFNWGLVAVAALPGVTVAANKCGSQRRGASLEALAAGCRASARFSAWRNKAGTLPTLVAHERPGPALRLGVLRKQALPLDSVALSILAQLEAVTAGLPVADPHLEPAGPLDVPGRLEAAPVPGATGDALGVGAGSLAQAAAAVGARWEGGDLGTTDVVDSSGGEVVEVRQGGRIDGGHVYTLPSVVE